MVREMFTMVLVVIFMVTTWWGGVGNQSFSVSGDLRNSRHFCNFEHLNFNLIVDDGFARAHFKINTPTIG
jgi:hypothetical protein